MAELDPGPNRSLKLFAYVLAWIAYVGAFLTHCADLGNVVRNSFADIHVPEKEDFYE
jgi:hypothetical protein